jgi:hypothetical protein
MNIYSTRREVEKPKTVKGRNELLRARAKDHAARLKVCEEAFRTIYASPVVARDLEVAHNLLEELAEALKP